MSVISRFPWDMLGVAVFTNDDSYGGQISQIIKSRIADVVLGLDPIDWSSRYKAMTARRSQPTSRPSTPSDPSRDFTALRGIYENPGYGSFELCLLPAENFSQLSPVTPACEDLISELPTLPGSVDPNIPTLMARWERAWATHIKFAHFDGDVFNATVINNLPTGDPSDPYWTYAMDFGDLRVNAEFFVGPRGKSGLGFTGGLWGAGPGVPGPSGKNIHERAEVWFDKL
ncbi:hypothetical protein BD779DRAFT_1523891 [Infundibulicybe gibba]|nr:hypothetical protein BD779DRAFT_1523891 [Infundibulicybe gibba]